MTSPTDSAPPADSPPPPRPRKRLRRVPLSRVSIQSKLLVMPLLTSILSAAVVGAIGYQRISFIVNGHSRLIATGDDGARIPIRTLEEGDFVGSTTLTRETVTAGAYAADEVTVVQIERAELEDLVMRKPLLLKEIGRSIEERHEDVRWVLAAADD
jgi:Cyclic nucleotide-binding domain